MTVAFEERSGSLVATLTGDYTDTQVYNKALQDILAELTRNPRRVIISMRRVSDINRAGLTSLEKLCWKVAKDLGQEIRLAHPSRIVRQFVDMVDFTIPIYHTVDKALDSFEYDEALE